MRAAAGRAIRMENDPGGGPCRGPRRASGPRAPPRSAGGGGSGKEENDIIIPSIIKSKNQNNVLAFGTYPADSFFTSSNLILQ